MTEWLLLVLLVPAIVVPVVLLVGFAGCDSVWDLEHVDPLPPGPIISAKGKSLSAITLMWVADPTAERIKFDRIELDEFGQPVVGTGYTFFVAASPSVYDDAGLKLHTTYEYIAYAVFTDGETSKPSAAVKVATLGPPTFDASGSGNTGSGAANATATWVHTASGDHRAVVVGLRWTHTGQVFPPPGMPTRTATYGGTSMQSLDWVGLNGAQLTDINGTFRYHEFFGLLDPPTGEQTVQISVGRPGAASITIEGCSVSYKDVSGFVSAPPVFGTEPGTSLAQPVSSAVNEMIVQMFTTASGAITGYNQTVHYMTPTPATGGFVIGDAPGAASVPFTASRTGGVDYAGLAVRLTPVS